MNVLSLWIIEWYISFPEEIGDEIFWRTNGDVMFKKDTVTCISFGLEPRTAKVVRVVPRGERTSNGSDLPDTIHVLKYMILHLLQALSAYKVNRPDLLMMYSAFSNLV